MIILDTNVVSAFMAADDRVLAWLSEVPPTDVYTTSVTRAELRFGLVRLPDGVGKRGMIAAADAVFDTFADRWLPFDVAAADEFGQLVADDEAMGRPIRTAAAQIAAVARARRATLATRSTKDFEECGVRIVNPFGE